MIDLLYTATPVISNIMSTFGDYTLFVAYKVRSELDLKARFKLGCSFICFTLVVPRDETICCVLSIEYATYTLFLLSAIDNRKLTYEKQLCQVITDSSRDVGMNVLCLWPVR